MIVEFYDEYSQNSTYNLKLNQKVSLNIDHKNCHKHSAKT